MGMKKKLFRITLATIFLLYLQATIAIVSITDFNIQKNEPDTNSPQVILYISAVDGHQMQFSCDNSTYSGWIDYAATYPFNLNSGPGCTTGDGQKTVYARVRDTSLNLASASDTINLDTTGPTINYVWHDANASDINSILNGSKTLTIRVSGEKDSNTFASIGTILDLNLYDDGAHNDFDANDGIYGASFSVSSFGKSISCMSYVVGKQVDRVGNISTKNSFTELCIDLNSPTHSSENPKNYANTRTPDINVQLLDAESGVKASSIFLWVNGDPIPDTNIKKTQIPNGVLLSYKPDSNISSLTVAVSVYFEDNAGNNKDLNWSFIIDEVPPSAVSDLNVKNVLGKHDLNIYWSAPLDSGGSGLSHFLLYRYTSAINSSNLSSATLVSESISSSNTNYVDAMSMANEDTTYYYAIKAVDGAGNISALSNSASATVPDISAPTDINFFIEWYVNSEFPDINVSGIDLYSARFSCNDANYSSHFYSFPVKTFSITSENGCTATDGNRTVYAWVFDNHDNNTKVQRSVFLDRNSPAMPSITSIERIDSNNIVQWSQATDVGSGISHYRIYYANASGITSSNSYATREDTNFSHKATGRTKYCYRVQSVDKAGNLSELSQEKCSVVDANAPTIEVSIEGYTYKNGIKHYAGGEHPIKIYSDYPLKIAYGKIDYSDGNTSEFSISGNSTTLSGTVFFKPIDGNTKMVVFATDTLDLNATEELAFTIDATPPDLNLLEAKQKSEELIEIKARFSEDTVRLKLSNCHGLNCTIIAELSGKDLNKQSAVFDWNIVALGLSDANIKAQAFDDLNNFSEKTVQLRLFSGFNEKIKNIESLLDSINSIMALLDAFLVDPGAEARSWLETAKEHIEKAKKAFKESNVVSVESELAEAAKLLEKIGNASPKVSVKSTQAIDYSVDRDSLETSLAQFLNGEALSDAKSLWRELSFKREIIALEVSSGQKTETHLLVVIYVKNTSQKESTPFNVVEFVPKSIGEKASVLSANTLFEIVEVDPVLSFFVPSLQPGEEKTIKYKPKKSFTGEEITALQASPSSFFKIPVPLPTKHKASEVSFGGMPGSIPLPLILIIMAAIIAYLYWRLKRL
ncbi:MAG: fibronectin type III domain-containing protein [Candidatus Diapherotrites archaeon]